MAPLTKLEAARMRAMRNEIYHDMRRAHHERVDRGHACLTMGMLFAITAIGHPEGSMTPSILALTVCALVAWRLVYAPARRATRHAILSSRYQALRTMPVRENQNPGLLAVQIEEALAHLYGQEDGQTMHAVNALAYNAAQINAGRTSGTLFELRWWERALAGFLAFSNERFVARRTKAS